MGDVGAILANAQQLMAIGLTYWSINALGQSSRMSSAMLSNTGTVRSPRMMPPMPSVSAMVWRRPNFFGISKSMTVPGLKPATWIIMITKSAPRNASRRSVVAVMVGATPRDEAILSATIRDVLRRASSMSWSAIWQSAKMSLSRMSPTRFFIKTVLPAPMRQILVTGRSLEIALARALTSLRGTSNRANVRGELRRE